MLRVINWISKTIDTHITPLAYLFCAWQAVYGFNHFTEDKYGAGATVLSKIEPLIPSEWWGLVIGIVSVLLVIGMLSQHIPTVQFSSIIGFSAWIMAAISYALHGYIWLHAPTAVIIALMFGYFFLAAGLDQLWDYSPDG
jgi:hypothetical protein